MYQFKLGHIVRHPAMLTDYCLVTEVNDPYLTLEHTYGYMRGGGEILTSVTLITDIFEQEYMTYVHTDTD